jgi:hypothetical protein
MPRHRRNRNRASDVAPKQSGLYAKELGKSLIWGGFIIPVGAMLIFMLFGAKFDNAFVIVLGLGMAVAIFYVGVYIAEAIYRFIKSVKFDKFDDPRKDKPVEVTPLPPTPVDLIDKNATYTLTSDGEIMEVVDDETPPPALTFKVNDEDEVSNL